MTPTRYRKKPVVIEAVQWRRDLDTAEANSITAWMVSNGYLWLTDDMARTESSYRGIWIDPADGALVIRTLEGDMKVAMDDWIIRGVHGEFYPCKPDIFSASYEALKETR